MVQFYRIPFSTNCERVALALAHKQIETESVVVPDGDRRALTKLTGQELVPVLTDGEDNLFDSTAILYHLEARYPERPLLPEDPAQAIQIRIFIEWFNRVWKATPNQIFRETRQSCANQGLIAALSGDMQDRACDLEGLLGERDYLFEVFSLADCVAYPFLKYVTDRNADDDESYHELLRWHQRYDGAFPRLEKWIERISSHPQV
jgi:glutathione S-transferase